MTFCPRAVDGIERHILFTKKGGDVYSMGSLEVDKYIFLNEQQSIVVMQAVEYMDGTNTIEEIQDKLVQKQHIKINVEQLCGILIKGGLMEQSAEMPIKKEFDEIKTFFVTIKTFSLSKVYGLLRAIPYADVLLFVFLALSIMVSVLLILCAPSLTFTLDGLFSQPQAIFYYLIVSTVSILAHEFSHAAVGVRYGLKPSTLTVAAYAYVSPMIYIKLPGIYFLPPKKRLITWGAGVIINISLLILSFSAARYMTGQLNLILMIICYCNLMIIIFSLNPVLYSDGYYLFSTLLKIPNLRKSSGRSIAKLLTGKARLEDIVYCLYFLAVIVLVCLFVFPGLIQTIAATVVNLQNGMNVWELLISYTNILIMITIGISARFFAKRMEKKTKLKT